MGLLDPNDPRNPHLPLNCQFCVIALTYMGTLTPYQRTEDAEPDVHVYRCQKHGVFRLTSKGLEHDE